MQVAPHPPHLVSLDGGVPLLAADMRTRNRGFVSTLIIASHMAAGFVDFATSDAHGKMSYKCTLSAATLCKLAIVMINRRAARHRNNHDEDRHAPTDAWT